MPNILDAWPIFMLESFVRRLYSSLLQWLSQRFSLPLIGISSPTCKKTETMLDKTSYSASKERLEHIIQSLTGIKDFKRRLNPILRLIVIGEPKSGKSCLLAAISKLDIFRDINSNPDESPSPICLRLRRNHSTPNLCPFYEIFLTENIDDFAWWESQLVAKTHDETELQKYIQQAKTMASREGKALGQTIVVKVSNAQTDADLVEFPGLGPADEKLQKAIENLFESRPFLELTQKRLFLAPIPVDSFRTTPLNLSNFS
jgi:hypothetical protein